MSKATLGINWICDKCRTQILITKRDRDQKCPSCGYPIPNGYVSNLWFEYLKRAAKRDEGEFCVLTEEFNRDFQGWKRLFEPILKEKQTNPKKFPLHFQEIIDKEELSSDKLGQRKIYRWILKDLSKNSRILEVACGACYINKLPFLLMFKGYYYDGIDCMKGVIEAWKITKSNLHSKWQGKLNFKCGLASKLPYKDNTFDALVSIDTIEHILDIDKFLKEVIRVLKPCGIMYIACPNGNNAGSAEHFHWFIDGELSKNYSPRGNEEQIRPIFKRNISYEKLIIEKNRFAINSTDPDSSLTIKIVLKESE